MKYGFVWLSIAITLITCTHMLFLKTTGHLPSTFEAILIGIAFAFPVSFITNKLVK